MKIILEREELIRLLGEAMGVSIDDDDVEVLTDPFEVIIKKMSRIRKAEPEASNQITPEKQVQEDIEEEELGIAELMGASESLVKVAPAKGSGGPILGPNATNETPPPPGPRGEEQF